MDTLRQEHEVRLSSWDRTRAQSHYHFDSRRQDLYHDVIVPLGRIEPTWLADLPTIIDTARPATWANRGYKGEGVEVPPEDLAAEEYDIERVGADPHAVITHLNWRIPASLQAITHSFVLEDAMSRIHVQRPGELWHRHIDKLQKWSPADPSRVLRVFIQLTDWQPGQFWEYGNFHWNQWLAGDVSTFDWANMPHCTANAGHHPRVTYQITGVRTAATEQFLQSIR